MEAVNNERLCEGRQAWFSVANNVRHPMLLAMPYPADAATFLHTLQGHLSVALAVSNELSERLSALGKVCTTLAAAIVERQEFTR